MKKIIVFSFNYLFSLPVLAQGGRYDDSDYGYESESRRVRPQYDREEGDRLPRERRLEDHYREDSPDRRREPKYLKGRIQEARDFIRDLNLTEEQKNRLRELRKSRPDFRESMRKLQDMKRDLVDKMKNPKFSEEEAFRDTDRFSQELARISRDKVKHALELRKILTPEQFSRMIDKMREKKEQFREQLKDRFKDQNDFDGPEF